MVLPVGKKLFLLHVLDLNAMFANQDAPPPLPLTYIRKQVQVNHNRHPLDFVHGSAKTISENNIIKIKLCGFLDSIISVYIYISRSSVKLMAFYN